MPGDLPVLPLAAEQRPRLAVEGVHLAYHRQAEEPLGLGIPGDRHGVLGRGQLDERASLQREGAGALAGSTSQELAARVEHGERVPQPRHHVRDLEPLHRAAALRHHEQLVPRHTA